MAHTHDIHGTVYEPDSFERARMSCEACDRLNFCVHFGAACDELRPVVEVIIADLEGDFCLTLRRDLHAPGPVCNCPF